MKRNERRWWDNASEQLFKESVANAVPIEIEGNTAFLKAEDIFSGAEDLAGALVQDGIQVVLIEDASGVTAETLSMTMVSAVGMTSDRPLMTALLDQAGTFLALDRSSKEIELPDAPVSKAWFIDQMRMPERVSRFEVAALG
jgi:hypothetical protein